MSANSAIEWTDATWNPVTGCTKVSPGCDRCYAETFAERFRGTAGHHFENGFDVTLRPDKLDLPRRWRKPRRIFVNSMSDLFHDDIPDDYIANVFAVMAKADQHTYQVLTKRHGRMRSLLNSAAFRESVARQFGRMHEDDPDGAADYMWFSAEAWPLPNVWLGVSVEGQQWADIRIPALLDTPAAVRWISAEPLLGPTDVGVYVHRLDWVVVGGESGPGARPMHPAWARELRDECQAAGTPYLFKQWGAWAPTGSHGIGNDDARRRFVGPARSYDCCPTTMPTYEVIERVGKHAAGRVLDGRTWDEYPRGRTAVPA